MEHHFNVEFAKLYGIEEAIIVHNLYYWIVKNIANNTHNYKGRFWTYNSNNAFVELFPYMNKTKICRVMAHLESEDIILKDNFNEDSRDRTLWYSFSDEGIKILKSCGYDLFKMNKCTVQNELCTVQNEPTIPYSKHTDNKHKEGIDKSIPKKNRETTFDVFADLSYVESNWMELWVDWLKYKSELKDQYKTQTGAVRAFKTLVKISNNNTDVAERIINQSIVHSWKGLFPLPDKNTSKGRAPEDKTSKKDIAYRAFMDRYHDQRMYEMYIANGYIIDEKGLVYQPDGTPLR